MSHSDLDVWEKDLKNPKSWKLRAISFYIYSRNSKLNEKFYKCDSYPEEVLNFLQIEELLVGYALELALKSIVIEKFPDKVGIAEIKDLRGKIVETRLERIGGNDGHDLLSLANSIEIDLTISQKVFLEHYTRQIRWQGRYPIKNKVKNVEESSNLAGGYTVCTKDVEDFFFLIIGDEYKDLENYFYQKYHNLYQIRDDIKPI